MDKTTSDQSLGHCGFHGFPLNEGDTQDNKELHAVTAQHTKQLIRIWKEM